MTITVNGQDAEPGCFVAGHHGQYAIDAIADVCEQFALVVNQDNDPRHWRRVAEDPDAARDHGLPNPEVAWDRHVWASEALEELLNENTTGGYWTWQDGEFFLVDPEQEDDDE